MESSCDLVPGSSCQHYGDDCPTLQDYPNCNIDCHFSWNVVPPVGSFLYKCLGVPTNASTVHFSLSKDPADSAGADLKISLNGETMYNYNLEPNDPQDINVTTHDPSPSSGDWNFYVANRDWLVWKHCNVHLVVQMT